MKMVEHAAHEGAVVRAFIVPARRARWLEALTDPARRWRFLDRLNHCPDLDPRFVPPERAASNSNGR
jgi:hypothetical protein